MIKKIRREWAEISINFTRNDGVFVVQINELQDMLDPFDVNPVKVDDEFLE